MITKKSYQFLKELSRNNNREWFAENKEWYEDSKANFEQLVGQLIPKIGKFAPELKYLEPKKTIFRIYRDTRFSKDKTPYKTHFGAVFSPTHLGKGSGYYIHIEPKEQFLTCGHYMLKPNDLKKMRKGIYDNFEEFQSIINEKGFKKEFGDLYRDENVLKRVPAGFDKDHPAAEYMKLKHFYVLKQITEEQIFSDNFVDYTVEVYKKMNPLYEFLNNLMLE